ncbi:hypothetical protein PR048_028072 [Dryococelus australis]|uniref:Ribosomal protein L2 n=1 Tax=Dryococelus australis TaxID=614101 RepID=A0ABQ9GIA3_9NEOP|nr:hypothetical protein PR048_028072 [Dryococelus australis]
MRGRGNWVIPEKTFRPQRHCKEVDFTGNRSRLALIGGEYDLRRTDLAQGRGQSVPRGKLFEIAAVASPYPLPARPRLHNKCRATWGRFENNDGSRRQRSRPVSTDKLGLGLFYEKVSRFVVGPHIFKRRSNKGGTGGDIGYLIAINRKTLMWHDNSERLSAKNVSI